MKIIESLDEWYEARLAGRLEFFEVDNDRWELSKGFTRDSTVSPMGVRENLKAGCYRWAPEEVTLVEWADEKCPDDNFWLVEGEDAQERSEGWKPTGRKVKGVIESE